jgi:prepilin-type processing-associated H-X9-DG protein
MNLQTQASSVDLEGDSVVVVWADGHVSRFGLVELRRGCTCAQCRELRARGQTIWPRPGVPANLEVKGAELMGAWGLSLRWNDRHEAGVYTWEMLRAGCSCELCTRS